MWFSLQTPAPMIATRYVVILAPSAAEPAVAVEPSPSLAALLAPTIPHSPVAG
jgi:hypothetical protein